MIPLWPRFAFLKTNRGNDPAALADVGDGIVGNARNRPAILAQKRPRIEIDVLGFQAEPVGIDHGKQFFRNRRILLHDPGLGGDMLVNCRGPGLRKEKKSATRWSIPRCRVSGVIR